MPSDSLHLSLSKTKRLKVLKPIHVLLFTLGVLLILAPIVIFIPEDGWNIFGYKMQFMTKSEFFHPVKQEKKDISKLVAKVDTTGLDDPYMQHKNGSDGSFGAPNGGELSTESSTSLALNELALQNLHGFFVKLNSAATDKKKIHIFHYGDSQIEGDRMTAYIRQRIQNQFGGTGPGSFPR